MPTLSIIFDVFVSVKYGPGTISRQLVSVCATRFHFFNSHSYNP